MKKTLFLCLSALCLIGMPSCKKAMTKALNEISQSTGMDGSRSFDDAESLNSVKEMLMAKCNNEKMPIVNIFITEIQECSGRAQFINVSLLSADKSQIFSQNIDFSGNADPLKDGNVSAESEPIDLSGIDMDLIAKGIENAKALIPDGFTYKVLRMLDMNKDKTRITMALTKDGEETVTSAGQTSDVYYDAVFEIDNTTGKAVDMN